MTCEYYRLSLDLTASTEISNEDFNYIAKSENEDFQKYYRALNAKRTNKMKSDRSEFKIQQKQWEEKNKAIGREAGLDKDSMRKSSHTKKIYDYSNEEEDIMRAIAGGYQDLYGL